MRGRVVWAHSVVSPVHVNAEIEATSKYYAFCDSEMQTNMFEKRENIEDYKENVVLNAFGRSERIFTRAG